MTMLLAPMVPNIFQRKTASSYQSGGFVLVIEPESYGNNTLYAYEDMMTDKKKYTVSWLVQDYEI